MAVVGHWLVVWTDQEQRRIGRGHLDDRIKVSELVEVGIKDTHTI